MIAKSVAAVGLTVVLAGCAGVSSGSGSSANSGGGTTHPSIKDAKVTKCGKDSFGDPEATVKVTNHSSKTSNYIIEVAFQTRDGKTQIDTGDAAVNSLAAGQTATQTAGATASTHKPFVCKVTDVTRYAANNNG